MLINNYTRPVRFGEIKKLVENKIQEIIIKWSTFYHNIQIEMDEN